jgi:DNA repair protein RadA/Sms
VTAPALSARQPRTCFSCSACGAEAPKWQGRCPGCGEWNTLVEDVAPARQSRRRPSLDSVALATVTSVDDHIGAAVRRRPAGIGECDRVLGGGIVPGSLILLGGDPGIGKSTLALELAHRLGTASSPSLYCAGEESAAQVAMRAARTGCTGPGVAVAAETDLDVLIATIAARRPPLAVVDSIQTVDDVGCAGAPGSVNQVRGAAARLLALAKSTGIPIVLVGHVTKEGAIAGPRTLEHMVDVVLYLEGEQHGDHRLLRGVKNRFGSTDDIGILLLDDSGIRESDAPGRAFLDEASLEIPGSALTVTCEGSRPIAVEVQALVAKTLFNQPRRTASGFDLGRLLVILAILETRVKIALGGYDVYLNAVGGVRIGEPAADLAAALAIAGAAGDRTLPSGCVVFGELGLGGEVRRVRRSEQRLVEAAALGMQAAILPAAHTAAGPPGVRCHHVANLAEALRLLR